MLENFKHSGDWFIPNTEEKQVVGIISYDSQKGIELELFGSLLERQADNYLKVQIILGISNSGKMITLYDCFETNRTVSTPGKTICKFNAQYMFIGHHFKSESDLYFDSIYAKLNNLDNWIKNYGFKKVDSNLSQKKTLIEFELPKPIEFKISSNLSAKINFTYSAPFRQETNKITIEQKSELHIKSQINKEIKDLLLDFAHFQNFITLGTFKPSYPTSLKLGSTLLKRQLRNGEIPLIIDFYFRHSALIDKNENYKHNIFLFSFQDIKPNFEIIIEKWYSLEKLIKPITNILIDSFYSKGIFDENKFLNMVQGLETFHRRFRKNKILEEKEHKKRKVEVLTSTPLKHKKWIENLLNFSNEPTLHMRLEQILLELDIKTIQKIIKDKEQFIKDVKNSRNYYTHYDKSLEKKAKKGSALFYLKEKLKILLICIVLKETGFSNQQIEKLLEKKEWIFFNHLLD